MTIKEEIQIEEYKRTFAEAYKQGFIDAMSVCKTEPITHDDYIESENDYLGARCLNCNNAKACKEKHWDGCVYEPKYEVNCSEKPNNCEVKNYCDDCLYTDTCDSKEFFYACTSKATISKMEQVDKDTNVRSKDEPQTEKGGCTNCDGKDLCNNAFTEISQYCGAYEPQNGYQTFNGTSVYVSRLEDEPQTETQMKTQNSNLAFEKRTMRDCYNCKRYETEGECIECHYEPKDEPQTE